MSNLTQSRYKQRYSPKNKHILTNWIFPSLSSTSWQFQKDPVLLCHHKLMVSVSDVVYDSSYEDCNPQDTRITYLCFLESNNSSTVNKMFVVLHVYSSNNIRLLLCTAIARYWKMCVQIKGWIDAYCDDDGRISWGKCSAGEWYL